MTTSYSSSSALPRLSSVSKKSINALSQGDQLDDEIPDAYLKLITSRAEKALAENLSMPSIQYLNPFFFSRLLDQRYASVYRWTKGWGAGAAGSAQAHYEAYSEALLDTWSESQLENGS
ncbi:hypothetical protein IAU59_007611 [Kwoniella sp. CBS 9459]